MRRFAMIKGGAVVNTAIWDGASAWDPVSDGLCDQLVEVTAQPAVGPGWSYAGGAFAAPGPTDPAPDPNGFVTAVSRDATLSGATRLAAVDAEGSLAAAVLAGQTPLITSIWQLLIAQASISQSDQTAVHNYAVAYGIPGI